jgi:hypothetical protein
MSRVNPSNPSSTCNSFPSLTEEQRALVERPVSGDTLFLEGSAGVGKTTVATARLRFLLTAGVSASEILVLAPQRTLLAPFLNTLRSPDLPPGGTVETVTVGGLARRMVDRFWPLVAERAGFARPDRPPVFLTLETAQYFMARINTPLFDAGAFDEVSVERNRLLSQILDNLNKAALVGLDHTQVGERLRQAWTGSSARAAVYDRAQQCANDFRAFCLAHNLLDFSLQIEVFVKHLLTLPWPPGEGFMKRFTQYRHVIVDNVEEDTPVTHDLLRGWLPSCDSAMLIFDHDAGYRVFLGADPLSAAQLRQVCRHKSELHTSFVTTRHLRQLGHELTRSLRQTPIPLDDRKGHVRSALVISERTLRFHPQMLDWVAAEISALVHEQGVAPAQIVIVAPYLSDALRFSLGHRLSLRGVANRSHRPSRALRDEPVARCLLTLTALAHPDWGHVPHRADVAQALALSIAPLDPVRAQLLTSIVYRPQNLYQTPTSPTAKSDEPRPDVELNNHGRSALIPFTTLKDSVQERIGYQAGNGFDKLRDWLLERHRVVNNPSKNEQRNTVTSGHRTAVTEFSDPPLDHFLSRLFGEVLSQPGFGFHRDMEAGRITAQLIESARKFRQVILGPEADKALTIGLEYIRMVEQGVIAAQYVPAWRTTDDDDGAVLVAPAYTFLMRNRAVDYQFWLNVGSSGWWERLYQPLTHPYVLTRHWHHGDMWTDAHEVETQTEVLHRLVLGLIRRCRAKIYLGFSERGEQGYDQRGPLLQAIQQALRRSGSARLAKAPAE